MRFSMSLVALVACAGAANAADLGGIPYGSLKDEPVLVAPPSWSGLYFGAHAGWVTGRWDGNMAYSKAAPDDGFDRSGKSLDDDGWLGGLQVGFNRQHGAFVWGVEADVSWADLNDKGRFFPYPANESPAWDIDNDLELFGTVRGRVGYLVTPRLLLYGTGGFAWGRANSDLTVVDTNTPPFTDVTARASADENHLGWAAGAGGELLLADRWMVRAEWLHVDLGKEDYRFVGRTSGGAVHVTDSFPASLAFDVFRLGLNYNFGTGQ